MSDARRASGIAMLTLVASCAQPRAEPTVRTAPPPELPNELLAPPVVVPVSGAATLIRPDTAREPHVDIDTHSRDEDVRPLLEFVARAGGYRLSYPTNLDRRVRVSLTNVPVSVALATLLEAADLTLESTTPGAQRPATRPVVFYELPVNVDSLSADAIVKRFGVSPAVAEMIVTSRGKP
jgi:hypothetical protein